MCGCLFVGIGDLLVGILSLPVTPLICQCDGYLLPFSLTWGLMTRMVVFVAMGEVSKLVVNTGSSLIFYQVTNFHCKANVNY